MLGITICFLIFGAFTFLLLIYMIKCMKEVRDKSPEEIENIFQPKSIRDYINISTT